MADDANVAKPRKHGQWYQVSIHPPLRRDPVKTEEYETPEEAEAARQRALELDPECTVTVTPMNYVDASVPNPSATPTVTWTKVTAADVIGGARTVSNAMGFYRFITYTGLDVDTLLAFGSKELESAKSAATRRDIDRHAINAVHYFKMALDCLFDAYLERDYLTAQLRPQAGFTEKLKLVQRRLGDNVIPEMLIANIVASPRDAAQHERTPPDIDATLMALQAARSLFVSTSATSNPLIGHAYAGRWIGGFNNLEGGGRQAYFRSFSPAFALLWRGRDGVARASVGQGNETVAEVRYVPLTRGNCSIEEHLELLRIFDGFGSSGFTHDEASVRDLLTAGGLDGPP
jgi:hypothetical protein